MNGVNENGKVNAEILEEIFSIEDFDCVDNNFMSKINENPEYRKLFEEARAISLLSKDSTPTPKSNGVSLHEAIMKRVADGDTQPRYIYTRKSFPLATAACLVVCFVVVLLSKSGILNKGYEAAFDAASPETADFEYFSATRASDKAELKSASPAFGGKVNGTAQAVPETESFVEESAERAVEGGSVMLAAPKSEKSKSQTEELSDTDGAVMLDTYSLDDLESGTVIFKSETTSDALDNSAAAQTEEAEGETNDICRRFPYTFSSGEEIYSIIELYEAYLEGEAPIDYGSAEYKEVWSVIWRDRDEIINGALGTGEYLDGLLDFISEGYQNSLKA